MKRCGLWIAALLVVGASVTALTMVEGRLVAADQPAPVTKESSAAFRKVVKQTLPAVVTIIAKAPAVTEADEEEGAPFPNFPGMDEEFNDELRRWFRGMPTPRRRVGGFGSGVIVREDGVILTNNHVVAGAKSVEVHLQDGRTFTSEEILTDPKTDLAIIKLDPKKVGAAPAAKLGDSEKVEIGDWVLAMGAPRALAGSVTAGIISAKSRGLGQNLYEDFLQTDAAINPGNSGGPIVDLDGNVIGINTAISTSTGGFEGIGFAVPSNMAKDVMQELLKHGKIRRGYLGIQMSTLDPEVAKRLGVEKGVEVRALTEGDTPARKAGLQPGDVIISVNGQPVTETKALQAMVTKTNPGDKVHFSIVRGGERKNVDVVVEEQPESFGMRREMFAQRRPPKREERPQVRAVQKLGVKVQEVTAGLANRLNIEPGNGVVVTEVDPDGIAANANLVPGSVILQVENAPVKGPEDLNQAMAKADLDKGVLMQVRLPDGTARLMIVKK